MMTFIGKLWFSCTETLNCVGRGIVTAYDNITHLVNLVKYDGYTDIQIYRCCLSSAYKLHTRNNVQARGRIVNSYTLCRQSALGLS